jgi:uncharacterized alkaline shock family protein YloU
VEQTYNRMVQGHASISTEVLARYAADAVREVDGVAGLTESQLPGRRGVRVSAEDGRISVELRLRLEWGASVPEVGHAVQVRVRDYLERMAEIDAARVDVVVDEIGPLR